ncbi:MAG: glycosyltransferase [Patescibacteria group bacterium]|nr:glycosyltransferase [Patescibacteria group bacterium]
MESPKISILLPTYNRAGLLDRAVKSILAQSFRNWELIAINDASSDNTRNFLDKLAEQDPRIRPVHHEKNYYPDISRTLNEGLALARGEYIARLDDDDYWCDDRKLEKQASFLDSHPEIMIAGGGTIVIDENDKEKFRYSKPETDRAIRNVALISNPFTHSTVMFRRNQALEAGGYGDFKNAEDWDLWLRLGTRGGFYNFQDYFVRYLMNDQSKTFVFKRSQSKEILRLISAHRREYPHFTKAFAVNFAQYCYSWLPLGIRRMFYETLSRAKRSAFGK